MITTFHQSLICLAVIEITFLLLVILDHSLGFSSPLYIALFPHLINPLKNIMMSCETFLIMSIALERLLAVCRPIHYRQRHASVCVRQRQKPFKVQNQF